MSLLITISVLAPVNDSYLTRLKAEPSGSNTDTIALHSLLLATLSNVPVFLSFLCVIDEIA